jgi:LysM domain
MRRRQQNAPVNSCLCALLRWSVLCAVAAGALGGCQIAAVQTPASEPPPAAELPAAQPIATASAPEPVAATTETSTRQTLDAIRQLLDLGQDEAAAARLDGLLASNQGGKAALTLRRSIREDPMALHGREHFAYTVVAGDTLALIAQRLLNDRDQFWSLARYNGIKVPRQLVAGQTLRVPGKARAEPALVAAAPPVQPVAAVADGDDEAAAARADRERKDGVERSSRLARLAMTRGDTCTALAAWDQVLRVEPYNREAVQQREKALLHKPRSATARC